jgi:hypothetical protein
MKVRDIGTESRQFSCLADTRYRLHMIYGGRRMMEQRRYRASGTDDHGDLHAFETDNPESAEEMRAIMGEDLADVRLEDRG